jgi:phosphoribosylaminoimidazole (AIR) synthetase
VPPLFELIGKRGQIDVAEMHRVFNLGLGMLVIVAPEAVEGLRTALDEPTWIIGELVPGPRGVRLA